MKNNTVYLGLILPEDWIEELTKIGPTPGRAAKKILAYHLDKAIPVNGNKKHVPDGTKEGEYAKSNV